MFDCSFRPQNGVRSIHYMGHVRMMAAVQPFISGAISKTINMPEECTVEDVMDAYTESWKLGLKAVAIYRDNSKRVQPLELRHVEGREGGQRPRAGAKRRSIEKDRLPPGAPQAARRARTPSRTSSRSAATKATSPSASMRTASPGELFITMAKEGSTISGLMDSFATAISYALQYGVPLKFFVDKFSHVRFEPSGWTGNPHGALREIHHGLHFPLAGREVPGPRVRRRAKPANPPSSRVTEPDPQQTLPFSAGRHRRPDVFGMRRPDDPQRVVLQVRELRRDQRV